MNNNNDNNNLISQIREVVQEELQRSSSSPAANSSTSSLITRTRSLVSSAASSAIGELNASFPTARQGLHRSLSGASSSALGELNGNLTTARRRSHPSHPERSSSGKKKKVETKTFEIMVLKAYRNDSKETLDAIPDYGLEDNQILIKQVLLNLKTCYKEEDIREKIVSACIQRLPSITIDSFEFVKREKNRIYTPSFASGFRFDYGQVKKLAGTGKIYIRLYQDENIDPENSDEDDLPPAPGFLTHLFSEQSGSNSPTDSQQPCCSRSETATDCNTSAVTLQEIFPDVPPGTLDELLTSQDINEVANCLADTSTTITEMPNIKSNHKHRLTVEEDTILEDTFCYYKSREFDPEKPLRIVFKGQDAIDAGGPLRQFFTLVADKIAVQFFEGGATNLVPTVNANTIISEMFVVVGKIIAHSIVHGCSGFPHFASAAYHYICCGSIIDAACYVTIEQVANGAYKHFIKEIQEADTFKLEELAQLEELSQIIEDIGEVCRLNESSKEKVIQSMMIFDVLAKRKASLDQIRTGLGILGILDIISTNPDSMRRYFVFQEVEVKPENLLEKISYEDGTTKEKKDMFADVVRSLDGKLIEKLVVFVSGVRNMFTLFKDDRIKVKFSDTSSIFASTCEFLLMIPTSIEDPVLLRAALTAVIDPKWRQSFNTY